MILVKHFMSERTEKTPKWTEIEDLLNKYDLSPHADPYTDLNATSKPRATLLQMKAYPTGVNHNVIVVLDVVENTAPKQV